MTKPLQLDDAIIMCYILCYLTETSMVMNCDVGATIALSLSHLMTTNATLFTDKCINTVTRHLGLSHLLSLYVLLRFVTPQ